MNVKSLAVVALVIVVPVASFWAASRRSSAPAAISPSNGRPVTLKPVAGTDLQRVVLSARAAERLGIKTVPVGRVEGPPAPTGSGLAAWPAPAKSPNTYHTVVPYSAVLYDTDGETWVYTNPEPLVFVRSRVRIDHIDGDRAALADGPPPGTMVVMVGGAELFGAEFEVARKTPHRGVQP